MKRKYEKGREYYLDEIDARGLIRKALWGGFISGILVGSGIGMIVWAIVGCI